MPAVTPVKPDAAQAKLYTDSMAAVAKSLEGPDDAKAKKAREDAVAALASTVTTLKAQNVDVAALLQKDAIVLKAADGKGLLTGAFKDLAAFALSGQDNSQPNRGTDQ